MDDVESERSFSRKKRKLTTRQGVVIGVATVAGLGLVTKLFSFLRRDSKQPKNLSEAELETLEAVLSGDAAKTPLPPPKFANLEPDSDADEPVDHYNKKDAAVYAPPTDSATQDVVDAANTEPETPHFQHPGDEDHENGDAVELIPGEDEVKPSIEGAVNNIHHLSEDSHTTVPVHSEEAHTIDSVEAHTSDEVHTIDSEEAHSTVPVHSEEADTTIPVPVHSEEADTTVPVHGEEAQTTVPVHSEESQTSVPVHSDEVYATVPLHSEEAHSKYSEDSERHAIEDVEKLPAVDHVEKLKHDSDDAEVEDVAAELPGDEGSNKQANGGSWPEHGKVVSDDEVKQQDDAEKVTEENVGSLSHVEPGKVCMEGEGNHRSEDSHNSATGEVSDVAEKLE